MLRQKPVRFNGILCDHFETGMEGCAWVFQDERFIGIPNSADHTCSTCSYCWNKERQEEPEGKCGRGKHAWELSYPNGMWAYEGMHVLENGDRLTVYDKADAKKVLWQGIVSLRQRKSYFELIVDGMVFHNIPKNVPVDTWKVWFFEGHPARLTLGKNSRERWEKYHRERAERKLKELGRS